MFISSKGKLAINLDKVVAIIRIKGSRKIFFDCVPDSGEHYWEFETKEQAEETYLSILTTFVTEV